MMKVLKLIVLSLCMSLVLVGCIGKEQGQISLIPQPAEMQVKQGWSKKILNEGTCSVSFDKQLSDEELSSLKTILIKGLTHDAVIPKLIEQDKDASLSIVLDTLISGSDAYELVANDRGSELRARDVKGLQAGLQTLLQLIDRDGDLPQLSIKDSARFSYRGIMLDVSRHFIEKDYILKLLDEMARYKLNRFHWHLVDGGGWRLEIEGYPKLIEKACYRTQEDWVKFWGDRDRRFVTKDTPNAYGGYYTKDDVREIVAHAKSLGITVVPEIELPGHSNELYFAYPELFCISPDKADFRDMTDVCIGKEATFEFFQNVLDEVIELFPSEYIHIGGDEAAMNTWECDDCKLRMKKEGLANKHELQSYMIKRIEAYLKSKGRKLIGWDEILMGGLPEDATVMSWRGESGGIKAANAGHDVVMTPNSHLYLDYYQTYGAKQARAIGGFVTMQKVYSYNPVPKAIAPNKAKHIMGVQANLWTEYIKDSKAVSRMLFPRILALSEVAWTPLEKRNYKNFRQRATIHVNRLRERGIDAYGLTGIDTNIEVNKEDGELSLSLEAERSPVKIHYTTDGTYPTIESPLYTAPLKTQDSLLIKARPFGKGIGEDVEALDFRVDYHKGIGKTIIYSNPWNERYPAAGMETLLDGIRATPTYLDGKWQGFTQDLDVTINLGSVQELHHIFAQFMQEREQWVYMPKSVKVWISKDGQTYDYLGEKLATTDENNPRPCFEDFDFYTNKEARYVRLLAEIGRSAGHFIFTDEIIIH